MVSNANIGPKPNAEHATVQMRMGAVRGFRQPVGMRRMAALPVRGFDSRAVPNKDDPSCYQAGATPVTVLGRWLFHGSQDLVERKGGESRGIVGYPVGNHELPAMDETSARINDIGHVPVALV